MKCANPIAFPKPSTQRKIALTLENNEISTQSLTDDEITLLNVSDYAISLLIDIDEGKVTTLDQVKDKVADLLSIIESKH